MDIKPYPIGTRFMVWDRFKDQEDTGYYGEVFVVQSYKKLSGEWHYTSELPWLTIAYEMWILKEPTEAST